MVEVRLTMEEYEALLSRPTTGDERVRFARAAGVAPSQRKKAKRVGKKDPKMARALRKANSMGRKKSGGYKKGWSQAKIMKKAHQLKRRM